MDITITIPDDQVDRVAHAYGNGPSTFGLDVTADNLAEVLTGHFSDEIRRTVQGYEAGQAATAAAEAVVDARDPLSTDSKATFATAAADVAEARAAEVAEAQDEEVKG